MNKIFFFLIKKKMKKISVNLFLYLFVNKWIYVKFIFRNF
jgi:hypothetical protein